MEIVEGIEGVVYELLVDFGGFVLVEYGVGMEK